MDGRQYGRPDNTTKSRLYIQDDANTYRFTPNDMHGLKHVGGGMGFMLTMVDRLNYEKGERAYNKYNSALKAEAELQTAPQCFSKCV